MSVTAFIRDLMEKGFSVEQSLVAAEAMELARQPTVTGRQATNRRYYEANKERLASEKRLKASECLNSDFSDEIKTPLAPDPAHVEDNLLPKEIAGKKTNKQTNTAPKARVGVEAFQSELSELDDERLEAFIALRRSKRGALTGYAAKMFRRDADALGMSLPQAVDQCISKNWITVHPNSDRRAAATGPPPRKRTFLDVARDRMNGNHAPESIFGTIGDDDGISADGGKSGRHDGDFRGGIAGRITPRNH